MGSASRGAHEESLRGRQEAGHLTHATFPAEQHGWLPALPCTGRPSPAVVWPPSGLATPPAAVLSCAYPLGAGQLLPRGRPAPLQPVLEGTTTLRQAGAASGGLASRAAAGLLPPPHAHPPPRCRRRALPSETCPHLLRQSKLHPPLFTPPAVPSGLDFGSRRPRGGFPAAADTSSNSDSRCFPPPQVAAATSPEQGSADSKRPSAEGEAYD